MSLFILNPDNETILSNKKISFNRFKGGLPANKDLSAKKSSQNIKYHETLYKQSSYDILEKSPEKDSSATTLQNLTDRSYIGNWYKNPFMVPVCKQNISTMFNTGSVLNFPKGNNVCYPVTDLFYTQNEDVTFYLTIDADTRSEWIKTPDTIVSDMNQNHGYPDVNYNPEIIIVPFTPGWKQQYKPIDCQVAYNNNIYPSVKIEGRCKGFSSFAPYNKKMALRLKKLDLKIPGLETVTDISLNNMISDFSKLHEYIIYKIFNDYGMPAPRANYCRLFINDTTMSITNINNNTITTATNHYLKNNIQIKFANDLNTKFYVINSNVTNYTFKVSLSLNGPEFDLSSLSYVPTQFYFDHGEYINIEMVQNKYRIEELFGKNNTKHLYEVDPIGGGYETDYGDSDRTDLYNYLDKTSPHPDFYNRLYSVADVNQFIKYAVIELYCAHADGFFVSMFGNGINSHLHSDKNGIFRPIPWGSDGYLAVNTGHTLLTSGRIQLELFGSQNTIKIFVKELLKFHNWISNSSIIDTIETIFAKKVTSFMNEKNPTNNDFANITLTALTNQKNDIISLLSDRGEIIEKFLEKPYPVDNLQATLVDGILSVSWDPVTKNLKDENIIVPSYVINIAEDGGSTTTIQTNNTAWSSSDYANITAQLSITVTPYPNLANFSYRGTIYEIPNFVSAPAIIPSTNNDPQPTLPLIRITEVMSNGLTPFTKDWFEITNFGSPISFSGLKMDDNTFQLANAVDLVKFGSWNTLNSNESVICIETSTPNTDVPLFSGLWGLSGSAKIATYSGAGVGLSSNSDGVIVFNNDGNELHRVFFGPATSNQSFYWRYNAIGDTIASGVSSVGIYGAYAASGQIASPGVY